MQYLLMYDNLENGCHEMKPCLTGKAQVNGRNAISLDEKFACDVWDIDHVSLCIDIKILLLTLKKLSNKDGIAAKGETTKCKPFGDEKALIEAVDTIEHGKGVAEKETAPCTNSRNHFSRRPKTNAATMASQSSAKPCCIQTFHPPPNMTSPSPSATTTSATKSLKLMLRSDSTCTF